MVWKYAGDGIGPDEIVNFPGGWKEAMILVIPYPNADGRVVLSTIILSGWFDFVGSSGALITYLTIPGTNKLQYQAQVSFRKEYIRVTNVTWSNQDITSNVQIRVYYK